jgi:hypothetical protein
MTDRGLGVARLGLAVNVRRLMYQPLICLLVAADDPRRLGAALDAEDRERLADALVDGVRRDMELGGDFLGREMLVDEQQAVELPRAQPCDALGHFILSRKSAAVRSVICIRHGKSHLAQHPNATPEQRVPESLGDLALHDQFFADF